MDTEHRIRLLVYVVMTLQYFKPVDLSLCLSVFRSVCLSMWQCHCIHSTCVSRPITNCFCSHYDATQWSVTFATIVCPSVCPSHSRVMPKRFKISKQTEWCLYFLGTKFRNLELTGSLRTSALRESHPCFRQRKLDTYIKLLSFIHRYELAYGFPMYRNW